MRFRRFVSGLLIGSLFCAVNSLLPANAAEVANTTKAKGAAKDVAKNRSADSQAGKESTTQVVRKPVKPNLVEKYLFEGKFADGETALTAKLEKTAKDDQTRFGLGVLQFLRSIEQIAQDMHRFGVRDIVSEGLNIPFLRLPVGENKSPETLSYPKARKIFDTLNDNLAKSEATLALIKDEKVKLPLHFGLIRMDLNGDGKLDESESLWKLYAELSHNHEMQAQAAEQFSITFDRGDVSWLRGYCHLLMSLCQLYLAHDTKEFFDCTAHIFFQKVDSPYPFLDEGRHVHNLRGSDLDVLDLIALVHLIRWEVTEPARMESVLHHLEGMVSQSKESWKFIMAETDDDHEWIPNPKQTGVIPNMRVTPEMVDAWLDLMNQSDKILSGKLLIAFWRGDDGRGVNLRRVFLEPTKLDLVLWVQGPAAAPYLEKGETTKMETWRKIQNAFGEQFPGFAVWFN